MGVIFCRPKMECFILYLIVIVISVDSDTTRKSLFLPHLPVIERNSVIKDSVGGWKDNAHIFKTPKACSSLKMWAGKSWTTFSENLGMHNISLFKYDVCIYSLCGQLTTFYVPNDLHKKTSIALRHI